MQIEVRKEAYTYTSGLSTFFNRVYIDGINVLDYPDGIEFIALLVKALEQANETEEFPLINGDEGETVSGEWVVEYLEDIAADEAESAEIYFVYQRDGRERKYSPQSFWEASGGCSWEESAQYGYDYGWDI